jgi:hypothetical protein
MYSQQNIKLIWRWQVRASSYYSNKLVKKLNGFTSLLLDVLCRSTCFGRLHVHHQELKTALTASGFTLERLTTLLPPRSKVKQVNIYLPSLMIEVPDHVYVLFCFLTASISISAILVTRCAFNTIYKHAPQRFAFVFNFVPLTLPPPAPTHVLT